MSLGYVVGVVVRRWYLLLAILVLAAAATVGMYQFVQPPYRMKAQVLLLPTPRAAADVTGHPGGAANPYLALTPGLAQTGQVISVATMDQQVAARLAAAGFAGTYSLVEEVAINAPVVDITVTAPNPAAAVRDLQLVVAEFQRQLQQAQTAAGAPNGTLIYSTLLTKDVRAKPVNKSRLRDGIATGAGVLFLGMLAIAWLERRAYLRRPHDSASASEPPPPPSRATGAQDDEEPAASAAPRLLG